MVNGRNLRGACARVKSCRYANRGFCARSLVTALADRRGSATDAAKLYRETEASAAAREEAWLVRRAAEAAQPRFPGRPTKRERRKLEDFLNEP